MTGSEFLGRLKKISWGTLKGAYGVSDGSLRDRLGDVPGAFADLIDAQDSDGDQWMNAIDVFYSHVSHQGDIFEVTPHVVPFLSMLAKSDHIASTDDLRGVLEIYREHAESYADSDNPGYRELASSVLAALEQRVEAVDLPPRDAPASGIGEAVRELEQKVTTVTATAVSAVLAGLCFWRIRR